MLTTLRNLTVIISVLILSACGGGSSNSTTPVDPPPPPPPPPANIAPVVDAGVDATIRLPDTHALDGTVTDDGLPAGAAVTTTWSVASGPAGATFADVNAVDTIVTFVSDGTYVLELTANDSALQSSDTVTVTVEAAPVSSSPPVANAGGPYTGAQGSSIALNGSGSTDADNDITDYDWDLNNDGTFETGGVNATFNSAAPGTFTISLRVTDSEGSANVDSTTVTVSETAPVADAGGPYSGDQGTDIALNASASSDPSGIATYEWDLDNDGSYETAGVNASFNSATAGAFTVGLQVTDNDGSSATTSTTVNVADIAPIADAGGPYSGDEGTDILLDASASSDPSGIATYEWDLDNDGTFETAGVNATFNSTTAGIFPVGLQVTDNDGSSSTAIVDVEVVDANAPEAPTNLSASGEDSEVRLNWAANSEPDLAGYIVERSVTQGGGYTVIALVDAPSTTYLDQTATNGTTYYYVIRAEDETGNTSERSTEEAATPNGSVLGYWKFDEGAGLTALDSGTPGDSEGTIVGATYTAGVDGSALDFDSTDHVVIDNTSTAMNITGTEITMVAWILPRDGGGNRGSRIISKGTNAIGSDVFSMGIEDYRFTFRLDLVDMVSSHIIRLNEWVHVAMVYNGVDKRIYVNGVLDAATPQEKSDPIDASTMAVHLGNREGVTRQFNGIIDEVRIYNTALSGPEITALYNQLVAVVPPPLPGLSFEDISVSAGIAGTIEAGHGVMFAEVDNDSLPDLYLTNNLEFAGPLDDLYFRNLTGVTFVLDPTAGIADNDGGSHGAVWADLDNDGDYDLFNGSTWGTVPTNAFGNPAPDNIYENRLDEVEAAFVDVTPATLLPPNPIIETRGVTAFDMDGDGDLDLYGVSSAKTLGVTEAYINEGGFAFSPVAAGSALLTTRATQGVTDTDYNNDGCIDILAASRLANFVILENGIDGNGECTGNFTRVDPTTKGISAAHALEARDGVTTADVDNDGDLDLLLVSDGTAHLYLRDANNELYTFKATFENVEGYMGGFADLDNDGWQDLVFSGDERVFMNTGDVAGTLFVSGQSVPVSEIDDPRGIAFADIDRDGDLDIAIAAKGSRNWLVENRIDAAAGNWLSVRLVSPAGQAGAFGAKVYVRQRPADGGALIGMREARGNHGYLAQDDPVLHFGLGPATAVDIEVDFVDKACVGVVTQVLNQAANQTIEITGVCP